MRARPVPSPRRCARAAFFAGILLAGVASCRTTVDSLGYNDAGLSVLYPMVGPASYPNPFRDVLRKTEAEIADKLAATFAQLFHGEAANQAIYFQTGTDQAYIQDILHDDIRTEGIGYAMMIAVQLNKRDEFDRLWRYAKAQLEYASGANKGYFRSTCSTGAGTAPCVDPFGHQQFLMALLLAKGRWASAAATLDYQSDAIALLTVMRHKEDLNGGVVEGVTNTFDASTRLVFDFPSTTVGMQTRPSIEIPAYYQLWAQATRDTTWNDIGAAARAHLKLVAHPTSGLMPVRATFAGVPVAGSDGFRPEGFRAHINMTLDRIWSGGDAWLVDESNRLLQFFFSRGLATYGNSFSLDGATTVDPAHDASLVAVNGVAAAIATHAQAAAFIGEVWNLPVVTGAARYYTGLLQLTALLVLGGQYRVY